MKLTYDQYHECVTETKRQAREESTRVCIEVCIERQKFLANLVETGGAHPQPLDDEVLAYATFMGISLAAAVGAIESFNRGDVEMALAVSASYQL